MFGLWLLWGYQLRRSLDEIELRVALAHDSHTRGDEVLSLIRTNVLLGSIYLRDALIDGASAKQDYYRDQLDGLRNQADRLLRAYLRNVESQDERRQWARLQLGLTEYWASREVAFTTDDRSTLQSAQVLRGEVVPRREHVLQIVDQLGVLQRAGNVRHRRETAALYADIRSRLTWMGAGTLMVALLVAVAASRNAYSLQRQLERQRRSEQENRHDLERLSARLVQVQEQERQKLARELHDAVGQALTAVKMDIGIALRAASEPRARAALEEARDIMETTLCGVRDLSQLLHPSTLDDFGLPATLTAHLRSFSDRTGISARLADVLEERLPSQVEVCVYRIVQEALNNIARHSGASECHVSLTVRSRLLHLDIEDNGRGLARAAAGATTRGLGLIAMRERAQMLGGTFAIENRAGGGARVAARIPLAARPADDGATLRLGEAQPPAIAARPASLAR